MFAKKITQVWKLMAFFNELLDEKWNIVKDITKKSCCFQLKVIIAWMTENQQRRNLLYLHFSGGFTPVVLISGWSSSSLGLFFPPCVSSFWSSWPVPAFSSGAHRSIKSDIMTDIKTNMCWHNCVYIINSCLGIFKDTFVFHLGAILLVIVQQFWGKPFSRDTWRK